MVRLTLVVAVVCAMCCALAMGQTPGTNSPAAASVPGSGPSRIQLGPPQQPLDLNALMQKHNGSLLEAVNEAASTPAGGTPGGAGSGYAAGGGGGAQRWVPQSPFAVAPAQPRTFKKHDIIFMIVNQTSETKENGTTALSKQADIDSKVDSYIKMNLAKLAIQGGTTPTVTPELKMENTQDFQGNGAISKNDEAQARFGCEVLDVKPNGTLVLQAQSTVKSDEESIQLLLTGVCRAEDITPDNTVLSSQCVNLKFQRNTKGMVHDTNKRGLFTKILDFVNPF